MPIFIRISYPQQLSATIDSRQVSAIAFDVKGNQCPRILKDDRLCSARIPRNVA